MPILLSACVIPMALYCMDCFRRRILPIYDVPAAVYDSIALLLKNPNVRNMTLTVVDNLFGETKSRILYEMVSGSTLRGLTFINIAKSFNFKEREYSEFEKHVRPIKEINRIRCDIRWQPAVNPGYGGGF